jgi:hypothetical protein
MPTCSSSEEARPSQKKCLPQARSHSDGVLRRRGAPESASARRRPSVNARSGLWQPAHARFPPPESRWSANSSAPSAIFSGLSGLSDGEGGGVPGRLNICRHTASTSRPCAPGPDATISVKAQSNATTATIPMLERFRGMSAGPCSHRLAPSKTNGVVIPGLVPGIQPSARAGASCAMDPGDKHRD